jgi:hypothetical protein
MMVATQSPSPCKSRVTSLWGQEKSSTDQPSHWGCELSPLSPSPPTKYWHQYRYIIVMEETRYEDGRSRVKSVTVPGPRYRIITLISHGIKVTPCYLFMEQILQYIDD